MFEIESRFLLDRFRNFHCSFELGLVDPNRNPVIFSAMRNETGFFINRD